MGIRAWDRIFKPFGIKDPLSLGQVGDYIFHKENVCLFILSIDLV